MVMYSNPFSIGFDTLFDRLERSCQAGSSGYPPHDIIKLNDDEYQISLAVAGLSADDIDVAVKENVLTIRYTDDKKDKTEPTYVHHGISRRSFKKEFVLSEHIIVRDDSVSLENGILSIRLYRQLPEEKKPRTLKIGTNPQLLTE